jgi:hypothetical protein
MSMYYDLEEIPESKLRAEIERRVAVRGEGRCDYCERPLGIELSCKMTTRHAMKAGS